jgi:hypothetical protein
MSLISERSRSLIAVLRSIVKTAVKKRSPKPISTLVICLDLKNRKKEMNKIPNKPRST